MKLVPINHDPFANPARDLARRLKRAEGGAIDPIGELLKGQTKDEILDNTRHRIYDPLIYQASKGLSPSRKAGDAIDYDSNAIMRNRIYGKHQQNLAGGGTIDPSNRYDYEHPEITINPHREPLDSAGVAPMPDAVPQGVAAEIPSYEAPPQDWDADRGPVAGFIKQLSTPSKYQMEPDLQETQTGKIEPPSGVAPNDLGINDAGQYVNMKTGEVLPEQPEIRRPNVLPLTKDVEGKPEIAMPKLLDVASNIIGGNVPGGGMALGSGFARAAKAVAPVPNESGFYSAVEHAVNTAGPAKASPEQWLGTIRNQPGVKADEIQWIGLEDWLKQQKGPVTKDAVQDYVRANQIEVKEVEKGGLPDVREQRISEIDAQIRDLSKWPEENTVARDPSKQAQLDALLKEWDSIHNDATPSPAPTKFGSYQIAGGENYRELLLTLPPKTIGNTKEVMADLYPNRRYEDLIPSERRQVDAYVREESGAENPIFKSSHWDEPNVLAHVRFNDRTIDGKKTLFLEEIQSDWHQKGKRQGYNVKESVTKLPEGWKVEKTYLNGVERYQVLDATGDRMGYAATEGEAVQTVLNRYNLANKQGVPDAPFKTTWPELALKRMIRYAAENGYDKVAWTPGEVQAARYDLSKQISRIDYERTGDGKYEVHAYDKANKRVLEEDEIPISRVEELLGKEIAQKITDDVGSKTGEGGYREWKSLTGVDLKVGGEGMKGFYDKILPAAANKLGKKYGAKVEGSGINQNAGASVYKYGDNLWAIRNDPNVYSTKEAALKAAEEIQPIHSLAITPELRRAAVEQGFPQFSTGGKVSTPRLTPVAHDPFETHNAVRRAMHGR